METHFSSKKSLDLSSDTALVLSTTEDNLQADLVGLKASFLYAENIQLASARLYYTLFLMDKHKNTREYRQILTDCLDALLSKRHRRGAKRRGAELRRCLGELQYATRADVDSMSPREPGVRMVNILPPDEASVCAAIELAEGFDRKAFTLSSYGDVVQRTLDFSRGDVSTPGIIPVIDQDTFEQLQGFARLTLGGPRPTALGPLAEPEERSSAYRAWAANSLIGGMPHFPSAEWSTLSVARAELKGVRKKFLLAMDELCRDLDTEGTPGEMPNFLLKKRLRIEVELEEIGRQLEDRRSTSRLVGAGLPQVAMGLGLALVGLAEHHMEYFTIGAFSTGGATAALTIQQLAQEANARRKIRDQARSQPYWLLYRSSEL